MSGHIYNCLDEHLYRPQRSWGKVIFSVACVKNSVHRGGQYLGRYPPDWYTPQAGTHPLGRYIPSRAGTPQAGNPPHWAGTPQAGAPPWAGTPPHRQVHPQGRYTPPRQVHPPGRYTPPGKYPLSREQFMLGDTGNNRAVRILLECILVTSVRIPEFFIRPDFLVDGPEFGIIFSPVSCVRLHCCVQLFFKRVKIYMVPVHGRHNCNKFGQAYRTQCTNISIEQILDGRK